MGSSFKTPLSNLIGPEGPAGGDGSDGTPATADAGATTTLAPGSSATVVNTGTTSDAVFDFGIPEGDKGDTGDAGTDGSDGAAATADAGTTTTGAPGSFADVTNVGTTSNAVFDFTIPSGLQGDDGTDGIDGVGIPVAGGTGQVLVKASAADYDTLWTTPAGGGDVTGPASAIDNHLATFDGVTGKLLKDSGSLVSSFATSAQGATADSALQSGDDISALVNDVPYALDSDLLALPPNDARHYSGVTTGGVFSWEEPSLNELSDVVTIGAVDGEFLTYNGSNWTPQLLPEFAGGVDKQVMVKQSSTDYDTEWGLGYEIGTALPDPATYPEGYLFMVYTP